MAAISRRRMVTPPATAAPGHRRRRDQARGSRAQRAGGAAHIEAAVAGVHMGMAVVQALMAHLDEEGRPLQAVVVRMGVVEQPVPGQPRLGAAAAHRDAQGMHQGLREVADEVLEQEVEGELPVGAELAEQDALRRRHPGGAVHVLGDPGIGGGGHDLRLGLLGGGEGLEQPDRHGARLGRDRRGVVAEHHRGEVHVPIDDLDVEAEMVALEAPAPGALADRAEEREEVPARAARRGGGGRTADRLEAEARLGSALAAQHLLDLAVAFGRERGAQQGVQVADRLVRHLLDRQADAAIGGIALAQGVVGEQRRGDPVPVALLGPGEGEGRARDLLGQQGGHQGARRAGDLRHHLGLALGRGHEQRPLAGGGGGGEQGQEQGYDAHGRLCGGTEVQA